MIQKLDDPYRNLPRLFVLLLGLIFAGVVYGQPTVDLTTFNQAEQLHQRRAMLVLGGWALTNIALGASLQGSRDGSDRYFHRMNAYWNLVNLGIAGFGYYAATQLDPTGFDLSTSVDKHYNFQKILLFNAGLDVGYVLGGLYLTERAKNDPDRQDQFRGFGQSIMLQGGFLFAFDLVNYFISRSRSDDLDLLLGPTPNGVGMILNF
jgi:hypothetical protein